jgi:L-threonylcarbamoyladenylate synthase
VIPDPIGEAVDRVRKGGLVAYPTETVWGIAADARSAPALDGLRRFKGRDPGQPIAILVTDFDHLTALGFETSAAARRLADAFWPGPLTLVLSLVESNATDALRGIAREDGAVGARCSSQPLAGAFARRLRAEEVGPVTATSLNRSGSPPASSAEEARDLCGAPGGPALIGVEGAECGGDRPSTVVDATGASARVLRYGAIGNAELDPLLREIGLG